MIDRGPSPSPRGAPGPRPALALPAAPVCGSAAQVRARVRLFLALVLCLVAAPESAARRGSDSPLDTDSLPPRVVAIGDVHGAHEQLRGLLRKVGLIDDADRWSGGDTVLVQTGDLLDRGPGVLATLELLRGLEPQARAAGGRVVVLLGNHETMNLLMDLRDVSPESLLPFTDRRSERRRRSHCRRVRTLELRRSLKAGLEAPPRDRIEARCQEETPLGLVEYIEALGPDAELGGWLRDLPVAVRLGPWLFVHGGLSPSLAGFELEEIDRRVHEEIDRFDRMRRHLLNRGLIVETSSLPEIVAVARGLDLAARREGYLISSPSLDELADFLEIDRWWVISSEGPLWYRGYANLDPQELDGLVTVLEGVGAERVAVGHTPRKSRSIEVRGGERFFLIDTGMLRSVYRGRAAALEISGERIRAIYGDGERQNLVDPESVPTP